MLNMHTNMGLAVNYNPYIIYHFGFLVVEWIYNYRIRYLFKYFLFNMLEYIIFIIFTHINILYFLF